MYSEIVLDHFTNRNMGTSRTPTGTPRSAAVCGDLMEVYLRIADGASWTSAHVWLRGGHRLGSMASEMIKGQPLEEAARLTDVAERLGGLPGPRCTARTWRRRHPGGDPHYYERHPGPGRTGRAGG